MPVSGMRRPRVRGALPLRRCARACVCVGGAGWHCRYAADLHVWRGGDPTLGLHRPARQLRARPGHDHDGVHLPPEPMEHLRLAAHPVGRPAHRQTAPPRVPGAHAQPRDRGGASAPLPCWNRSISTEMYLCHACSDQEIEDGNGASGEPGRGRVPHAAAVREDQRERDGVHPGEQHGHHTHDH
jgi:hypothetical protein